MELNDSEDSPMTVRAEFGIVRIGVRDYFAAELLWNARHMAELARNRERELLKQGFRGLDRALRSYVTASLFQSIAAMEAYVNGVWGDAAEAQPDTPPSTPQLSGLDANALRRLKELWSTNRVERSLSTIEKFQVALTCVDQPRIDMGTEPGQTVNAMIRLRNDLMHFKPRTNWSDEEHHLLKALQPRLGPNPLTDTTPWFPHQVLTASCAWVAYEAVIGFSQLWRDRMGITWNPAVEHTELVEFLTTQ